MTTFVVDTHALVWYLTNSRRLGKQAADTLERRSARLVIPTIVLAELKYLHTRNRIPLSLSVVTKLIAADSRCLIFPLTEEVVRLLPVELDIHDAIICATAFAHAQATGRETAVLTRDEAITRSGLVSVIW